MGFIYTKVNFQVATCICMLAVAVFYFAIAYISDVTVLLVAFLVSQTAFGAYEAGSNMFILHLWGKETTPFMQSLHFAYGVGALFAPMIASPFLVEKDDMESMNPSNTTSEEVFHPEMTMLVWPYSIVGAFLLLSSIFAGVVWRISPETTAHPSRVTARPDVTAHDNPAFEMNEDGDGKTGKRENPLQDVGIDRRSTQKYRISKLVVILLVLVFMHIYLGLEISFGFFLTSFAVKSDLKLSKATGAQLTTTFWSTFTLFRILTVFYIEYLGQVGVITGSLVVILVANGFLVPFGNTNLPLLWTGVGLIGVGISSVWACVFGYLEEHFPVTPMMSALMVVSAVLGEFVFPVIISAFIDDYPQVLMWVTLFCSTSIAFIFAFIALLCSKVLKKQTEA